MKNLIALCFLLIGTTGLFGQVRLDVEGDAKIRGRMDITRAEGDSTLFIGLNAGINDSPPLQLRNSNYNTFVGTNAGENNTTGYSNAFFGLNAGQSNTGGSSNAFFGLNAGKSNTEGTGNAFFGRSAGFNNTTGQNNTFFGRSAGRDNTTGSANAFFGLFAGLKNTGSDNAFFGLSAGHHNTSGSFNTFFGTFTGGTNNNTRSTVIGYSAQTTDSLDRAIAIGHNAVVGCHNCAVIGGMDEDAVKVGIGTTMPEADLHVKGDVKIIGKMDITKSPIDSSMFIGANAGMNDSPPSGFLTNDNIFVGTNAGQSNTTGYENAFFGLEAGQSNTDGYENAFFGWSAGFKNTSGNENSFFGWSAGIKNTSGHENSFFGWSAGIKNSTGEDNAFFGKKTGFNNTSGNSNAFFGMEAGSAYNNTRSTMVGYDAETLESLDRAIAIGYNARVGCNNCAVIGGTGADSVKVGIGTMLPEAKLDIVGGDIAINNGEVLLRDGNDENHGLGWYGAGKPFGGIALDGPALYGFGGGALGFTDGNGPSGNKGVLFWKNDYRVGINVSAPSCALDVAKDQNGTEISPVRIRDLPTANAFQYDNVIVDSDGNLYRGVVGSRIAPNHDNNVFIKEQK